MLQPITIQLLFLVSQLMYALHDAAVIDIQNYQSPVYKTGSEKWHKYSAAYYGVFVLAVTYASGNWYLLAPLGLSRAVFFPVLLNTVRTEHKGFFYLSDIGFDGLLKKVLGKYAAQIMFVGGIITIVLLNFILYNNL